MRSPRPLQDAPHFARVAPEPTASLTQPVYYPVVPTLRMPPPPQARGHQPQTFHAHARAMFRTRAQALSWAVARAAH